MKTARIPRLIPRLLPSYEAIVYSSIAEGVYRLPERFVSKEDYLNHIRVINLCKLRFLCPEDDSLAVNARSFVPTCEGRAYTEMRARRAA